MEEYVKTTLKRAKDLYNKSQVVTNPEENKVWRKNAQFALESALRLTLLNLNISADNFVVNFSEATPDGNELFLNGRPLDMSIEGLYELPPEKLEQLVSGGDMLLGDTEFKK